MSEQKAEHFDWRKIIHLKEDAPDIEAALNKYFEPFAMLPLAPGENGKAELQEHPCLNCGEVLNPSFVGAMLGGGVVWGLAHGECHCSKCRWPARAYHYCNDANGEEIFSLKNVVIQYHPDFVGKKPEKEESA